MRLKKDEKDVDEARALFEKNIAAIKRRDKAAYLSVYLESDRLARTSPDGPVLGFAKFSKQAGTKWPDTLEADDLRLMAIPTLMVAGGYVRMFEAVSTRGGSLVLGRDLRSTVAADGR